MLDKGKNALLSRKNVQRAKSVYVCLCVIVCECEAIETLHWRSLTLENCQRTLWQSWPNEKTRHYICAKQMQKSGAKKTIHELQELMCAGAGLCVCGVWCSSVVSYHSSRAEMS